MRVDPGTIRLLASKNGLLWTAAFVTSGLLRRVLRRDLLALERLMLALERRFGLPGIGDNEIHYRVWQGWDWRELGEEWTESEAWKRSLIEQVLERQIGPGGRVLEIGPGAGRWTEELARRADQLVVVDVSDRCIELCRQRFSGRRNIEYLVNDGQSLAALGDDSIDYVWSYDVFVHLAPETIDAYLGEIGRVLRDGGRAVVHHAKEGGMHGGARSRMTAELFRQQLQRHQLTLLSQFDSWGERGEFGVRRHRDAITVFCK